MNRLLILLTLLFSVECGVWSVECICHTADSIAAGNGADTTLYTPHSTLLTPQKKDIGTIRKTIRGFSKIDNRYIEPQHYNWAFMVQSTFNYDVFIIKGVEGQKLTLSPDVIMKIGPFFGWRWLFLGYTFDLKNISLNSKGKLKTEFDLSLYSNQIGIDLYYRRTGSDYKIRHAHIGDDVDNRLLDGTPFDGIKVGITGASMYYIFNHKRFSYPAAFAQSTRQKISCGSWMAGIGYTRNSLDLDYDKLESTISERVGHEARLDSGLRFNSIKYYNLNASVGYAYNWVFAKNWLACGSMSAAVAYKRQQGDMTDKKNTADFVFRNFNVDAMARIAVVYNNNRWFAGMSALMNQQNYMKSRFECSNVFGSINVYCGLNFGVQKKYRKKKKRQK